jgi:aminoglycoside 2''-phosphotransferase
MTELDLYLKRVQEISPDLAIEYASLNREGLLNDVVIVNGALVFRFARSESGFKDLKEEAAALRLLRKHITLPIPTLFYEDHEVLAYPLIPGETLRRDLLMSLPETDQQAIADQLALFFKELHGIPMEEVAHPSIPMADALMEYEDWANVYQRMQDKVFPLLLPDVREWATGHFESWLSDPANFEYEPRMVDTDIPPTHILFDRMRRRISGIIDFGCAGLGDPAADFSVIIYHYGESFMDRFYKIYPEAEGYLRRARFHAGAIEMRWLLNGIEQNDPTWFAIHNGEASDVERNQ